MNATCRISCMRWLWSIGLALLCAIVSIADAGATVLGSAIVTESGPLKGTPGTIDTYLGIPYAAAPVGELRWMPPQAFGRWPGLFLATQFGSICPQEGGGQEDCLFLNIYVPHIRRGEHARFPVMVWIHGGGLQQGAGSQFDPTPLVESGVIVVTLNYRLGLLGFLAQSALDAEGHLVANYGLLDQQFALAWVQRNIAAFGGESYNVTVFGESAGGLSVYSQVASPLAAGLFARAIAQSGAYAGFDDYLDRMRTVADGETMSTPGVPSGVDVANAVGCSDQTAACLRSVPAAALVALAPRGTFPFVDGVLLPQTPGAAFASGTFNRVPVMTGTNHDEYRYFVAENYDLDPSVGPLTNAEYPTAIDMLFSALTPAEMTSVLAEYPLPASPAANAASLELGAAGTDGTFVCNARHAMQSLAQYVPVYAYEFNDENAPPPLGTPPVSFPLGAYHGADVQYLFNRGGRASPFTFDQMQLSRAMVGYWTSFAMTGDPNAFGAPAWAPYDPATDLRQSLVPPTPTVEAGFAADHQCAFWDAF